MPVASALLLGVLTAVGGGLMRDVVANEVPAVFDGSDLYVIPATTGAALTVLAVVTGTWGPVAAVVIPAFAFAFRMVAWRLQWRVPAPMRGWSFRGFDTRLRRARSVFGRPGPHGEDDDEDHYEDDRPEGGERDRRDRPPRSRR